jgi:hypothetical protein
LFWSPDIAQAVLEVNAYLSSLKAKNILILDAYSLLAEKGQVKSNYVRDTLHLNERGYKVLNQELTNILSTQLVNSHFAPVLTVTHSPALNEGTPTENAVGEAEHRASGTAL